MRYFYLRSEDRIKNFHSGLTQCPHKHGFHGRPAKECLQCLRDLVDSFKTQIDADALEDAVGSWMDNLSSAEPLEFQSTKLVKALIPIVRPKPIPPGVPIGCIASNLVGDSVKYAISVCSQKDSWNKKIARNMAITRLRNMDKSPRHKSQTGSVDVSVKPVKIEVLKRVASATDIPKHARRAARDWLTQHPPKEVVGRSDESSSKN